MALYENAQRLREIPGHLAEGHGGGDDDGLTGGLVRPGMLPFAGADTSFEEQNFLYCQESLLPKAKLASLLGWNLKSEASCDRN